jgi:hypothetical protein
MPDIARLRELLAEGTPRPWIVEHNNRDEATIGAIEVPEMHGEGCLAELGQHGEDDAALIVAAVNALPKLLDVVNVARFVESTTTGEPPVIGRVTVSAAAIRQLRAALASLGHPTE